MGNRRKSLENVAIEVGAWVIALIILFWVVKLWN